MTTKFKIAVIAVFCVLFSSIGWFFNNKNYSKNQDKTVYLETIKSAQIGNAQSQYSLGNMYYDGRGIKQNYQEALKWYQQSAKQGNAESQNKIGDLYRYGYGVNRDYQEALKWYQQSAKQNYAYAQYNLGLMYDMINNYQEALKWYLKAANQGNAEAQIKMGDLYRHGNVVKRNMKQAIRWYQKGAIGYQKMTEERKTKVEQDSIERAEQLFKLALASKDIKESLELYKIAAELGNSSAQYNLGIMYSEGKGVNKNTAMAQQWFGKAAKQGNKTAKKNLASYR